MHAMASIRNGPFSTLNEDGEFKTYSPITQMTKRLYADRPPPSSGHIVILHRHRTGHLHYSATSPTTTQMNDEDNDDGANISQSTREIWTPSRSFTARYNIGRSIIANIRGHLYPTQVKPFAKTRTSKTEIEIHRSFLLIADKQTPQKEITHHNKEVDRLEAQIKADEILTRHARSLNLDSVDVNGSGDNLLYSINATHHAHTRQFLMEHDELRITACVLACEYYTHFRQWTPGDEGSIAHLNELENNGKSNTQCTNFDEYFTKAIASIRNGPIIILNEDRESSTYETVPTMVEQLYAS